MLCRGESIKILFEATGLKQKKMAQLLDVSPGAISGVLAGKRSILGSSAIEEFLKICSGALSPGKSTR
jgi:transcriptional regulator with XRE-family HTH domain